jgi:hypothetical protein
MQVLAAAAIGLLVAASIAVGFRLLALHRRSGAAPELLLGLMLLLSVGVGYPLLIAADRAGPDAIRPLLVVSALGVNAGFGMLYVFTWRVFRPQALWARLFAGAGVLAMAASAAWRCHYTITQADPRIGIEVIGQSLAQTATVVAAYGWTAFESLRYWGLMRRRARIGLAEPEVANRFLLWGLMSLFVTAGVLLNSIAMARGIAVFQSPSILLASSTTGLAQAILLVLAFLPPRFYSNWVRARAATLGA